MQGNGKTEVNITYELNVFIVCDFQIKL